MPGSVGVFEQQLMVTYSQEETEAAANETTQVIRKRHTPRKTNKQTNTTNPEPKHHTFSSSLLFFARSYVSQAWLEHSMQPRVYRHGSSVLMTLRYHSTYGLNRNENVFRKPGVIAFICVSLGSLKQEELWNPTRVGHKESLK